jgi:hypothetical protein
MKRDSAIKVVLSCTGLAKIGNFNVGGPVNKLIKKRHNMCPLFQPIEIKHVIFVAAIFSSSKKLPCHKIIQSTSSTNETF